MPIPAQTIIDRVRQVGLDAEGAEYYDDNIDIIPAINAAVEWLVAIINSAFGQKKMGEEVFQDLVKSRVFQPNNFSRIFLDSNSLGHEVWTILGVYPLPKTLLRTTTGQLIITKKDVIKETDEQTIFPTILGNTEVSIYRKDLVHLASDHSAKRLTIEEWAKNRQNPFAAGNEIIDTTCDTVSYAYLNYADYRAVDALYTTPDTEIEIRPTVANKLVTVFYSKKPDTITQATDNIEFPGFFGNWVFESALRFISIKQGDQTTVHSVTTADIGNLIQSVS